MPLAVPGRWRQTTSPAVSTVRGALISCSSRVLDTPSGLAAYLGEQPHTILQFQVAAYQAAR